MKYYNDYFRRGGSEAMTIGTNTWQNDKLMGGVYHVHCPLLYPFPFNHLQVFVPSFKWLLIRDNSTQKFSCMMVREICIELYAFHRHDLQSYSWRCWAMSVMYMITSVNQTYSTVSILTINGLKQSGTLINLRSFYFIMCI